MIKRILIDYKYHLKENGKDFSSDFLLYYWLYDYVLIMSEYSKKGAAVTISMAVLILFFVYIGGFCPIKPEKTMYLCPISQKYLEKYLHTQYLLKTIPCSIVLFAAAFAFQYFSLSYGWVWVLSVWLFILLINTRVSAAFYQNRKIIYETRYCTLKLLAWLFTLLAYWFHDTVFTIHIGSGSVLKLPIGALFFIPSFLYTGMAVYLFWKNVCRKMGNYELVYQYIRDEETI